MTTQDSLAKRAISSTAWQTAASLIITAVSFVRSILLARWLPVEAFGIYGYASALITISTTISDFGMTAGFVHRTDETEDEEQAAANYFTLRTLFIVVWAALVILYTSAFVDTRYQSTIQVLILVHAARRFTSTPQLVLQRRVVHRRLSLLSTLDVLLSSLAALAIARWGTPLWALIITDVITLLVYVLGLYVWRPVWRPKFAWSPPIIRYYLSYGARNFVAGLLSRILDQFDDIWTGNHLGSVAVGFYSKAYSFATYPRKIIARPLIQVSTASYAELKQDRQRLSQAFFRINATLVRSSFLLGGLLVLIAPEFIRILLGQQWIPMLTTYRLMLVFTLLDPIKSTIANLFDAVGKPERVIYTRTAQLVVLLSGLAVLGPRFGIAGVAVAVDAMLILGIVSLLQQATVYVDFSMTRLFGAPAVALLFGLIVTRGLLAVPGILGSDWRTGGIKSLSFILIYAATLLTLEHQQIANIVQWIHSTLKKNTL